MHATFNNMDLGHDVVHYRTGADRLAADQQVLLWRRQARIGDESPGWLTRIELLVRVAADDVHALNASVVQLAGALSAAGLAELAVLEGTPGQVRMTCAGCRFDGLDPAGAAEALPGKQRAAYRLRFTSASAPVCEGE